MKHFLRSTFVGVALLGMALGGNAQPASNTLEVLHWWTSASEHAGVVQLQQQLSARGVQWKDASVTGGGGIAANKVEISRMLQRDAPDVTSGAPHEWADAGWLVPLNAVAQRQQWRRVLFPQVMDMLTVGEMVVKAPLGIHRINSILYNRTVFERLNIAPPHSWAELEAAAKTLKAHGVRPLAWSDEPWQLSNVLEVALLSEGGPNLYRKLIVQRDANAWQDVHVTRALQRLRWLRQLSLSVPEDKPWSQTTRELFDGKAGMMIHGDWARGELLAWGANPSRDFGCVLAPGTEGMHLYTLDTFSMLKTARNVTAAQLLMAQTIVDPATQLAYNRARGSVPVRRDVDVSSLDSCGRDSWKTFADPNAEHLPSLAWSADQATKEAVSQTLRRYVTTAAMEPAEAQRKLALTMQPSVADAKRR